MSNVPHEWNKFRDIAEQAARNVGERIRRAIFDRREHVVNFKSKNNPVTDLDVWSENALTEAISANLPDHNIFGEERDGSRVSRASEIVSKGHWWIIDPIDGTNNFSKHIPHVGISLGLLINGVRTVGVVYDPCRDELYSAVRGQGAFLNGVQIHVSAPCALEDAVVGIAFANTRAGKWEYIMPPVVEIIRISRAARNFGAGVLTLCWVASGRLDYLIDHFLQPWDVAAASLIVEEAQGVCCNVDTATSPFAPEAFDMFGRSFLCGNRTTVESAFQLVQRIRQATGFLDMPSDE